MQLKQLQDDMIAAMKARDKVRKDALSVLVSAVKKCAIDEGCREDVPESLTDSVILKEIKSVKEQLETCRKDREELRAEYQARYDIFMEYAPSMMSAEEVEQFITENFAEVLAGGNQGLVMKSVMPQLKGRRRAASSMQLLKSCAERHEAEAKDHGGAAADRAGSWYFFCCRV